MKATHCWQVDGAWRVGSPVIDRGRVLSGVKPFALFGNEWLTVQLMQHYHTGKIEAVPVAWLHTYPIEEISPP
jgi:hypothetical protein